MTTNDRKQAVDGLAQVLAEHRFRVVEFDGAVCSCGAIVTPSVNSTTIKAAWPKHQAAVVLAHLEERGTMSVWRFTYPATGRRVERTTIIWERDL